MAGLKSDRELFLRTVSGVVLVGIIVSGINFGGIFWQLISCVIALGSMSEYYKLVSKFKDCRISPGIGYIFALMVLISAMRGARPDLIAMLLTVGTFVIFLIEIFRKQLTKGNESNAIANSGAILSGVIYIAVPWVSMILLREYSFGRQVLMTLFCCTWGCDVFAYIGGRLYGRSKLCAYVSPGKTWAGFVWGIVGSLVINAFMLYFYRLPAYPLMLIGIICGTAGQAGDLAESLIKREAGEKDSGRIIPGHGGILDRFDSILINGTLTCLILEVLL